MKSWLTSLLALSLISVVSCAPAGLFVEGLPDDPDTEPTSTESNTVESELPEFEFPSGLTVSQEATILSKYAHLDPKKIVPTDLLRNALVFYDANLGKINNRNYLSVIDFSKNSTAPRLFIINMSSGSVWALHVAHGKGSDRNADGVAERFSNASGSNASSLGYYLTAETYYGKHGLSLRIDGLSSSNSNARRRAVVIHGATYVKDQSVKQGRSWGCPAVSMKNRDQVIKILKGGSLIYADR